MIFIDILQSKIVFPIPCNAANGIAQPQPERNFHPGHAPPRIESELWPTDFISGVSSSQDLGFHALNLLGLFAGFFSSVLQGKKYLSLDLSRSSSRASKSAIPSLCKNCLCSFLGSIATSRMRCQGLELTLWRGLHVWCGQCDLGTFGY